MKALLVVSAIFLLLLLLPGCIYLTNEEDCRATSDSDKNDCYFDLAVRYAIVEQDSARAVGACNQIGWSTFGNDKDQCIGRVAAIMEDPSICNNIQPSLLEGDTNSFVLRRLCISEATPRGQAACSSIFIIAPLFAIALFSWFRKN